MLEFWDNYAKLGRFGVPHKEALGAAERLEKGTPFVVIKCANKAIIYKPSSKYRIVYGVKKTTFK